MTDSTAKRLEKKQKRNRFLVYQIKDGSLSASAFVQDFDTREDALKWIKGEPSRDKFTILEEITGGGGK